MHGRHRIRGIERAPIGDLHQRNLGFTHLGAFVFDQLKLPMLLVVKHKAGLKISLETDMIRSSYNDIEVVCCGCL